MSVLSTYETPWQYETPRTVVTGVPRSLVVKAVLESYTFPPSPFVPRVLTGFEYPVRLLVHNVGTPGKIAGGVVNSAGNPGTFTYFDGAEIVVSPGAHVRTASSGDVPNCNKIDINRKIRFNSPGTYTIKLWAMHEEAGKWYYDQQVQLLITVTDDVPPNGPPNGDTVTVPIHVFNDVRLKADWFELWKIKNESLIHLTPSLLVSAKLDYTVQYLGGTPIAEVAKIDFDGVNIVTENLNKGEAKSGSVDLTGSVSDTATVTIKFESFPGFTSTILFDVWLTLVYSEEPPEPPGPPPFNWEEFINKYGKWIALGVTGIIVVYLMRPRGAPIIVIPGGRR